MTNDLYKAERCFCQKNRNRNLSDKTDPSMFGPNVVRSFLGKQLRLLLILP